MQEIDVIYVCQTHDIACSPYAYFFSNCIVLSIIFIVGNFGL